MAGRKSEVDRVALALSKKAFIGKGPIDFEHVLYDPVNLKYFKDFCVSEMSTENLLFWLEVEDYKDIKEAAINMRLFTARKIARKYIDASATQQLGIEDRYKTAIMEGLKLPEPPPHLFTEAQQQIFVSMKTDSFPRFLESQMYKELIAIKLEDRKVVDMKDFDLYRFLGAGGFGMVLLTQMTATKKYYATKVIDKRILISQNQTHSIFREKEVLALVEHPFIVALRYAFQTEDHLCFVLDFIEGGNMYSDLMRGPYTHKRAVFYTAQIVLATEHLHELDILYRDLKPDNVLLTIDGHVKLADMGAARGIGDTGEIVGGDSTSSGRTAKVQPEEKRHLQRRMTITGTHGYRAPEVYDRDYGKAADWWNVGILIIEMLTAENPLRGENRRESEYAAQLWRNSGAILRNYSETPPPLQVPDEAQGALAAGVRQGVGEEDLARLPQPRPDEAARLRRGGGRRRPDQGARVLHLARVRRAEDQGARLGEAHGDGAPCTPPRVPLEGGRTPR